MPQTDLTAGATTPVVAPVGRSSSAGDNDFSRRSRVMAKRREGFVEAVLLAPPLLLVLAFVIVPIFIAIYLSMTNWDGFTFPAKFIGGKNYIRLATDPDALHAAGVTAIITIIGAIGCNVLGLGVALLLNGNSKFNSFMRVLVFYPYVIGPVILGFLWSSILSANGAFNAVLTNAGAGSLPFLSNPTWALASLIAVIIWSSFGVNVVLYLAGLQTIPDALIEAAVIDGASPWQIFWRVKLPLLAPTVTVNVVLVVVGLLRVYELILALTAGGPAGTTQSVVYNILTTSFNKSQLGYGAAQSVVLMVVIVIITISITSLRRRSEQAVAA